MKVEWIIKEFLSSLALKTNKIALIVALLDRFHWFCSQYIQVFHLDTKATLGKSQIIALKARNHQGLLDLCKEPVYWLFLFILQCSTSNTETPKFKCT